MVQPHIATMQVAAVSAKFWDYRLDWFGNDMACLMANIIGYRIAYMLMRYHDTHAK